VAKRALFIPTPPTLADYPAIAHDTQIGLSDSEWAERQRAELKALDPPPTAKEPTWANESGLSRKRHQWEDLGYGT